MLRYSLLLLVLALSGCRATPERIVLPAFYHWQTRVALGTPERTLVDSLGARRLYLKFFDVDWSAERGEAVPLARIQAGPSPLPVGEIVPTVFITNRTLQQLPPGRVPRLAERLGAQLARLAGQFPEARVVEWQFDCDWTATTRARYFALLEALAARAPCPVSVTIRLHQVADPAGTGVPPVARGVLMYYNTGELRDWQTDNSILEDETAAAYLARLPGYPLLLDVALPLFRWGVVFHPTGGVELLNHLTEADVAADTNLVRLAPRRYAVRGGTYLRGRYLSAGDRIRLEGVAPEALLRAAGRLRAVRTPDSLRVLFYPLDAPVAGQYSAATLERVVRVFEE